MDPQRVMLCRQRYESLLTTLCERALSTEAAKGAIETLSIRRLLNPSPYPVRLAMTQSIIRPAP